MFPSFIEVLTYKPYFEGLEASLFLVLGSFQVGLAWNFRPHGPTWKKPNFGSWGKEKIVPDFMEI